ncbi:uncharacterized protein LOC105185550 [Harpegnathos saltator]|uniref:Uncharacterized protein n=1 Tax=Harpegnathos saltator TaxID=610380 RepID=E2BQR3_HARSA|nr:uncharacterized protein LOC105185550 [Harpegnathos saltator]XP_011143451.1 uncharacterized protein LOC105185550 [Harpegnathos saltator]EFN81982.1 hypothetical protein EAI_01012 [Harpegnathos saltator]
MPSQRRRHSRWRILLVLLVFVGLIRHSELTSAGIPESSSLTSAPVARKKSQDFSSLGDFSWQAWFMVDTQAGAQPGADSATLLRRITPKSVFIAPALPACAEGYEEDAMDRCVKHVDIDQNAHFSFLLQRLNTMYANRKSSPQNKQPTGPLQVNIPLMASVNSEPKKPEAVETLLINDPLAAVMGEVDIADDKKTKHEAVATAYEVKNETTLGDKEKKQNTSFHESSSLGNIEQVERKPDAAVPVAEFAEETNDTSFLGVVDYKIPADLKILLNVSGAKGSNASDTASEDAPTTDKRVNPTEMSPLMLLLSTLIPSTTPEPKTDDLPSTENNTVNHTIGLTSNYTSHVPDTKEEIAEDNKSGSYELPAAWSSEADDKSRDNETRAEDQPKILPEGPRLDELHEADFIYDDEAEDDEYVYSTDTPDEESTETEEILKHGEAGMTIPTRSPDRAYREHQRLRLQNQTGDRKKTAGPRDQVVIRFNDSTPTDKDEAGSNISSEVSIDGDLILETTLLDVNTERLLATSTQSSDASDQITTKSNDGDDPRQQYDQDQHTIAPELVLSSKDGNQVGAHSEDDRQDATLESALFSSESLLYDPPEEDHITEIHAIDEDRLDVAEESTAKVDSKELGTTPRNAYSDSSVRFPINHELVEGRVRFPDAVRQQQQQQTYVRFPGSEANSIHSANYKHQHTHETPGDGAYGGSSTKSSVPTRQKPVYHLTAPSWKPDRQQDEREPAAAQRQKQALPPLLRLWSKMPLIRDPSLPSIFPIDQYQTNRSEDDDSLEGGPSAEHRRRSSSLSRSQRVDKAAARVHRRTSISG